MLGVGWEPPAGVTEDVTACPHSGLVSFEHNAILLPADGEAELLTTSKLPALFLTTVNVLLLPVNCLVCPPFNVLAPWCFLSMLEKPCS